MRDQREEIILLLCTSECSLATVKLAVSAYTVSLLLSLFPLVVLLIIIKKVKGGGKDLSAWGRSGATDCL